MRALWKRFRSTTPAWVIVIQSVLGLLVTYGTMVAATNWTGPFLFLNKLAPELISIGTIGGIALQFVQRVESIILEARQSVTNTGTEPVTVEVPADQAAQIDSPPQQ